MKNYLTILAILFFSINATASKYDDARKLYKEGPTKAPQIIKLLKEHIADHPVDIKAYKLMGITQFGTEKNKEALATFNKVIELQNSEFISPEILMLKARTLYALNQKAECKRILRVFWAFWQGDEELEKTYEWYWEQVKDIKEPKPQPTPQLKTKKANKMVHSIRYRAIEFSKACLRRYEISGVLKLLGVSVSDAYPQTLGRVDKLIFVSNY